MFLQQPERVSCFTLKSGCSAAMGNVAPLLAVSVLSFRFSKCGRVNSSSLAVLRARHSPRCVQTCAVDLDGALRLAALRARFRSSSLARFAPPRRWRAAMAAQARASAWPTAAASATPATPATPASRHWAGIRSVPRTARSTGSAATERASVIRATAAAPVRK